MKMEIGKEHAVRVNPSEEWFDTEVDVEEGQEYQFTAKGSWVDWFIPTDADGFRGKWMRVDENRKRVPNENFLALMGSINKNDKQYFRIGCKLTTTFTEAGRLYCFANDVKKGRFFLRNNWGCVSLKIKRLK